MASFDDNHIDGRALAQLTKEDLTELGVKSIGHRLAILRARGAREQRAGSGAGAAAQV